MSQPYFVCTQVGDHAELVFASDLEGSAFRHAEHLARDMGLRDVHLRIPKTSDPRLEVLRLWFDTRDERAVTVYRVVPSNPS